MENLLNSLQIFNPNNFDIIMDNKTQNSLIDKLVSFAEKYELDGNIYHHYVAYCVAMSENAFSKSCENSSTPSNSILSIVKNDIDIINKIFNFDLSNINISNKNAIKIIEKYSSQKKTTHYYKTITEKINTLSSNMENAKNTNELLNVIVSFYSNYGCGELGLFNAFRLISAKDGNTVPTIVPITNVDLRNFDSLVGYEFQKKQLIDNTETFLKGNQANNVLLYGDGGTGKSSSIKALLNQYSSKGLKIIQVYKNQFATMNDVISIIKERNYKFILYLDDLSFEEFEVEYKHFKAIIEGGLETKPQNVLIYATSNRRHLIKETFSSRNDYRTEDDVHKSDTVQEMLSLSARFGLSIYYPSPNQIEFLNIVNELAKTTNITMTKEELERKALQWQMRGNGLSGRSAQQFIYSLN